MKTIRQKAYRRQRVIYEVIRKGRSAAEAARLHGVSRMSVYRWLKQYDGSIESLYERSRRPHSHPNQQTAEEYALIKKVWSHNKQLGLVCLHMVLEDRHGYTRCISSLHRAMRKMEIGRKKQRKKKHVSKPYKTPETAGERVQVDVKYVPKECLLDGMPKLYQYTAVDECTRLRVRYIFDEHSNWNSVRFLHYVRKKVPFDIKCVQTDNGTEFTTALVSPDTTSEFERYCKREGIHHKRIRVATPRHNGKVERVHRMDSERFYASRTFYSLEDANKQLQQYQRWDNNFPLLVLGRKSPLQYWREISA